MQKLIGACRAAATAIRYSYLQSKTATVSKRVSTRNVALFATTDLSTRVHSGESSESQAKQQNPTVHRSCTALAHGSYDGTLSV